MVALEIYLYPQFQPGINSHDYENYRHNLTSEPAKMYEQTRIEEALWLLSYH